MDGYCETTKKMLESKPRRTPGVLNENNMLGLPNSLRQPSEAKVCSILKPTISQFFGQPIERMQL